MVAARPITSKTKIFQLKIQLARISPPIWRRILVPGEVDLGELHAIIQSAFGWTDSHLHEFEVGPDRYGTPDPNWGRDNVADESRAKLFRLAREGEKFTYTYDFGDGWEHQVAVEKVTAPKAGTRYPTCAAGRRACPPEDVGGPWNYPDFCEAIKDPEHPEHEERLEWVGGSFDPNAYDLAAADAALKYFAWTPLR